MPTSSEQWESDAQRGKYPVKIYTIDGVLIYQVENGTTNTDKAPLGGVISQSSVASSMLNTIANPITYYGGYSVVINQAGHSGDLYNYYWTSYSRGTDGNTDSYPTYQYNWHNAYLDGYIPLRVKSIYDPCPYLYRIPSNGIWNQFTNSGWTNLSYLGGASWRMDTNTSWYLGLGMRNGGSSAFEWTGGWGFYYSSTAGSQTTGYALGFNAGGTTQSNRYDLSRSFVNSVRCIEVTRRYAHTFCQQKVCKNSQHFFLRFALESVLDYKELACARGICYRIL